METIISKHKESVEFSQDSEIIPIQKVIIHRPSIETFMSMLHPAASLFQEVTSNMKVQKNYDDLCKIFESFNIEVISVRDALKLNKERLLKLAFQELKYQCLDPLSSSNEELTYYLSDDYKRKVISKLDLDQQVDIIFTRPTYTIRATNINTKVEFANVSFNPLGNLIYTRDQQITTKVGVVMGHLNSSVRSGELQIMKTVFLNQNIDVIDTLPDDARLEGGDFVFAREDLAFLGIGMRTNLIAAEHLLINDLFGTKKVALVVDEKDNSQDRMHLDTFFNTASHDTVIMLDFEENAKTRRKLYLYEYSDDSEKVAEAEVEGFKSKLGNYFFIKCYDYIEDYLIEEKYTIMKVSNEEQMDYITNFLSLGNNTIIAVNPKISDIMKRNQVDWIKVVNLDFEEVKKMYGAVHCATQVCRTLKKISV